MVKGRAADADPAQVARRPIVLACLAYVAVQVAVVAAYLTAGDPLARITVNVWGDVVTVLFAVVGTLAVGRDRLTGWLAVVSIALLGLGDEVTRRLAGPDGNVDYPGPPDLPYAAGSGLLIVLFVVVVLRNRRSGVGGAWLDTGLASAGLVTLSVQFGLVQALESGEPMTIGLSLLYGGVDLVGIVVAVWCLVSGRALTAGIGLVAACCSIWYLSDLSYTVLTLTGAYTAGGLLDLGWYVANALLAWSCWTGVSNRDDASRPGVGHTRRLLLAGAVGLFGPVGLVVASALGLTVSNLALVCSTVLPMTLALARMHGLLRRLEHQAAHDHLTGLLSRAEFTRRASHDLAERRASAVLLIDVDGFKRVNDTLGHSAGDDVLVEVARRIAAWAPAGSVIGRLGGDEFAVVLPAHRSAPGIDPGGLAPLLRLPVGASSGSTGGLAVTASVGWVELPGGSGPWNLDGVLAEADHRMYRQKPAHGTTDHRSAVRSGVRDDRSARTAAEPRDDRAGASGEPRDDRAGASGEPRDDAPAVPGQPDPTRHPALP